MTLSITLPAAGAVGRSRGPVGVLVPGTFAAMFGATP